MSASCAAGVVASGTAIPPGPWLSVQPALCQLFWLDTDATDSGAPSYNITSLTDKKGGASVSTASPGGSFARLAQPAAPFGLASNGIQRGIHRAMPAAMKTAVQNGDHSFALRCRPLGGGVFTSYGIQDLAPDYRAANFYLGTTFVTYQRYDGTTTWQWGVGFSALSNAPHTFGVSVDRVNGTTTTVSFYVDGALVGTDSQTTRDLTFVGAGRQTIGTYNLGTSSGGDYRGGGDWSSVLTLADHQTCHAYFQATDP